MHINYYVFRENPIGLCFSFFLLSLVVLFGFVSMMNIGFYGYGLGLETLLPAVFLILVLGFWHDLGKEKESYSFKFKWYKFTLSEKRYDNFEFIDDGKYSRLVLKKGRLEIYTPLTFSKERAEVLSTIFN